MRAAIEKATAPKPPSAESEYELLLRIHRLTGLCLNEIGIWFEGVDVERIVANIEAEPIQKWSGQQTHAAIQSLYASENLSGGEGAPIRGYVSAQIKLKGDQDTIRRMLTVYSYPPQVIKDLAVT